jgi:hypothetical protein
MIQSVSIPKIRLSALAIGALGLVALMPHLGSGTDSADVRPTVAVQDSSLAQRPLLSTTPVTNACGAGAYVTGDLAGDASPAAIYATMCDSSH